MKVLILIACSIFAVNAMSFYDLFSEEWSLFKTKFNKNYKTKEEEKFRFKIYLDNKRKIEKHNEKFLKGEVTYELGVNQFSDMLSDEFVKMMNGFKFSDEKPRRIQNKSTVTSLANLPKYVNWVKKGAVTPVKDQGTCMAGWAFSATGALEGRHFISKGNLISLSEQNLIDCSKKQGNNGCNGGYIERAFSYVLSNHGIDTEKSYPYEGKDGGKCRFNKTTVGTKVAGYMYVPIGDELMLNVAVAHGPVSVTIDASLPSFKHYKGGVYKDPDCNWLRLTHAVLIVGYGVDNATQLPYWLVKNSWGTSWGEDGYARMIRNCDNHCGIATAASYPIILR